ncbi:hypothetical protein [Rubricoccus marinus]|uniref:Uncharacterized protein n=1 Tax=Rubricoccus marinus TaxID=716817 RepID=A0A259TX07_9BACT|nr:hypothetical protein [Rubricoccus marinus]OZC02230.1 hypothetical protein BSZ36_04040 [Rubricoccus marinus]
MREALRIRLLVAVGVSALLMPGVFALAVLQGATGLSQQAVAGGIYGLYILDAFARATVLDLAWWASGGMLLAAFVVAHRRGRSLDGAESGIGRAG